MKEPRAKDTQQKLDGRFVAGRIKPTVSANWLATLIAKIIVRKRLRNVLERRPMARVLITNQMLKFGSTYLNPDDHLGLFRNPRRVIYEQQV